MRRETLRIGVLGCGSMGSNHLRVLSSMQECELVGCCDVDTGLAAEKAKAFDIEAYATPEELFGAVDAVHVVVPSKLHRDMVVLAASKGCHVLVEKPIALVIEDAREMISACRNAGVRLCVGHVERYNPVVLALGSILKNERPLALDFHRMSPFYERVADASVVQDLMIHDADVLLSLVPSPVDGISAHGASVRSGKLDYCQALVHFENGVCASLTASRVTESKIRTADITCEHAFIEADYINRSVEIARKTSFSLDVGYEVQYRQENIREKVVVPISEPLRNEFAHFVSCIRTGDEIATSGEAGLKALELCMAIEDICEGR